MSDSMIIAFESPTYFDPSLKSELDFTGCNQSWQKVSALIEQGELVSVNPLASFAYGLTSAKNKLTATVEKNGVDPLDVLQYELSVNIPASMVGNNALLENHVYLSALCSKLMVQKHMLLKNVHTDIVKRLVLPYASLESVTLTFLFKFPSNRLANEALGRLTDHARMIFCHGRGMVPVRNGGKAVQGKRNAVKQNGEPPEFSTYINDPDFHVTAYVKPGKRGASFAQFDRQEDATAVYAISETCVRVEVKVSLRWLMGHGLSMAQGWKGSQGTAACQQILEELRCRLRIDEKLRRNEPQERHLASLSSAALTIVQAHLNGQNIWELPQMVPNRGATAVAIHREVLNKLHIDMEYPWHQQRGKADPKLGDWLCWDNQFQIPPEVAHLCMVRSTLKAKVELLKGEVNQLMDTVAARQAAARAAAKKSGKRPSKPHKLLSLVKRQWKQRRLEEDSEETSDVHELIG